GEALNGRVAPRRRSGAVARRCAPAVRAAGGASGRHGHVGRARRRQRRAVHLPAVFLLSSGGPSMRSASTRLSVALGIALALATFIAPSVAAQPECTTRISCENARQGAPPEEWDVEGAGDPSIQGFATPFSVSPGERVDFKVDTDAPAHRLDIYRIGYYGGAGARRVASIEAPTAVEQPGCLYDVSTGLVDCGNWQVTSSWVVPAEAVSGLYIARAVRTDTGGASHILFVVREPERGSDILVQFADT